MINFSVQSIAAGASGALAVPASALGQISPGAVIDGGAVYSQQAARTLGLVADPVRAAANGTKLTPLQATARFLGRVIPVIVIGANAMQGAQIVKNQGTAALLHSREGRSAVLGGLSGSLLLVPTPLTQVGAAGLLALVAVNEFGGLSILDRKPAAAQTGAAAGAASVQPATATAP